MTGLIDEKTGYINPENIKTWVANELKKENPHELALQL